MGYRIVFSTLFLLFSGAECGLSNQKDKKKGGFQVPNDYPSFCSEFPELLKFELPTIYLDLLKGVGKKL